MTTKRELVNRWQSEIGLKIQTKMQDFFPNLMSPKRSRTSEELRLMLIDLPHSGEVSDHKDLRGVRLIGGIGDLDFSGWDFSYAHLDFNLVHCNLTGANFSFSSCHALITDQLINVNFKNANLSKAFLAQSTVHNCCFDDANLQGTDLFESDFRGSTFLNVKAKRADFTNSNLLNCDFRNAILDDAAICGATLDKSTDFRGASLINLHHEETRNNKGRVVLCGVDWRQANFDAITVYGIDPNAFTLDIIESAVSYLDDTYPTGKTLISKLENLKSNPGSDLRKKLKELMEAVSGEEKELLDEVLDEAYKLI